MSTETGKKQSSTHIKYTTRMENPNKSRAQRTSNTLKSALNDEAYLKAFALMERIEKNALANGLYELDHE